MADAPESSGGARQVVPLETLSSTPGAAAHALELKQNAYRHPVGLDVVELHAHADWQQAHTYDSPLQGGGETEPAQVGPQTPGPVKLQLQKLQKRTAARPYNFPVKVLEREHQLYSWADNNLFDPVNEVLEALRVPAKYYNGTAQGSKHTGDMSLRGHDWATDADLDVDLMPIEGKPPWQQHFELHQHLHEMLVDDDEKQRERVANTAAQVTMYMVMARSEWALLLYHNCMVIARRSTKQDKVVSFTDTLPLDTMDPTARTCLYSLAVEAVKSEKLDADLWPDTPEGEKYTKELNDAAAQSRSKRSRAGAGEHGSRAGRKDEDRDDEDARGEQRRQSGREAAAPSTGRRAAGSSGSSAPRRSTQRAKPSGAGKGKAADALDYAFII